MTDILPQLCNIVGEKNVLTENEDRERYGLDWTRFVTPDPLAIVYVRHTDELCALVQLARRHQIGLVPSGGRTGLSGGACAVNGEIVVSFDRMNRVLDFDETDRAVTVEAGMITAALQQFAADKGLYYPVDFASSGSSQIGGNIATNAGGIRVLRYGLTRHQITGLKVVTGRGDCLDLNGGLKKNNTGYDLRHLFIGSEGTLGFIAEATIQLIEPPVAGRVLLLAVSRMTDCLAVLTTFRQRVSLSAFEFFGASALDHVLASSDLGRPFAEAHPYYVLLEFDLDADAAMDAAIAAFDACMRQGYVTDGIIATSESQNMELWQYRERISEAITPRTPYKNDIAVRISQVPGFLAHIDRVVNDVCPEFETVWFGHIGDGNLHLNILKPVDWPVDRFKAECERVSEQVLALVQQFGGSVSAEHGIGLLKKNQLHFSRAEAEIDAMRAIKAVFDPDGIMNPGKLIDWHSGAV